MQKFKTFTGLEYLKIDIANQAGKDKLNFEDRLQWFEDNIPESIITMDNVELKEFVYTIPDPDNIEQLYTALLAYQDYWYKRPSGYRVSLDAVCSGLSLMSCLTADVKGLENTGLLGNKRADLYSAVYQNFCKRVGMDIGKTRANIKEAIMTFGYGSSAVPERVFEKNEKWLQHFYDALHDECNGAVELREYILSLWDKNTDLYHWVLPDGFVAWNPVMVEKKFEKDITIEGGSIKVPYSLKVQGCKKSSVELMPNSIHSIDGMLVREMYRRCMFDSYKVQEVLYALYIANNTPNMDTPVESAILENAGKLGELIYLYNTTKFVSVRIIEYIVNKTDALLLSREHREKLINILELMLKQGNIEVLAIHDSFSGLPNKMNYIRYWYKEMCADLIESNILPFMVKNIFNEDLKHPVSIQYRKKVAKQVRESNYGLC